MTQGQLIKLDYRNSEQIKAISSLQSFLLPESSVSRLGRFFMEKYYYKILAKKELIDAYLYKNGDKFVGFIVCTDQPFDFMKKGVKGSLFYLSCILFLSCIAKPSRIKIILDTHKGNFSDNFKKDLGKNTGQFMSFGVLEDYRKLKDENSGMNIPDLLMRKVFDHFKERQKVAFFLLVLKSNLRAINFYNKYNATTLAEKVEESIIMKFDPMRNP